MRTADQTRNRDVIDRARSLSDEHLYKAMDTYRHIAVTGQAPSGQRLSPWDVRDAVERLAILEDEESWRLLFERAHTA